ncbi:multicopper oxidase domain-containing protein [Blastococcus sp. SYSU DS1024]
MTLLHAPVAAEGRPRLPYVEERSGPARGARSRLVVGGIAGYLLAAAVTVPVAHVAPAHGWIALHLLLLGAATNAVVVFSRHFAGALLHARDGGERAAGARLLLLNAGVVLVLLGVGWPQPVLTALGGTLVVGAVAWHVASLVAMLRRSPGGGRLRRVVHYYVVAGAALVVGGVLGTLMGTGRAGAWLTHTGLYLAHVHLNLLGWIGLTVLGTGFMLWPAVLRTRMADDAPAVARRVLLLAGPALAVLTTGLLLELPALAAAGLAGYAGAVAWSLAPVVRIARTSPPRTAPAIGLAAATGWLLVALAVDAGAALQGPAASVAVLALLVPVLGLGFVAQVLVAALTFLLPATLGRGPSGHRLLAARLQAAGMARAIVTNAGVALLALPLPAPARALGWALALTGLAAFLPLLVSGVVATRRVPAAPAPAVPPSPASLPGALPAAAVLTVVAVLGWVLTGGSPVTDRAAAAPVSGAVVVELGDSWISPASISVPAGERLVLDVRNVGSMRHDLRLEGGRGTAMLAPGASAVLDVGEVTGPLVAWCTVPGHRQAGMLLAIEVDDGAAAPAGTAPDHAPGHGAVAAAAPGPAWVPYDPTLQPAPGGTVHDVDLPVVEGDVEVAPGVRQRMWTFGGTVPGPVLRGRVGDVFHVRLVNDGSLPHSVDFHASQVAPDRAMRSIDPGEELVYSFRADRAGAWLYHCGTVPVLQHVGMGMYGAVVIDPPGLPPVDRELVFVQSDIYLGPDGDLPGMAVMTDADYDVVAFNGYAGQYEHAPVTVRAGERIRAWVVAAGPSAGTAFHVVGAQFDTVYREGAYVLRADDGSSGGAQVLDLAPAQGGFVEFALPEPGRYPFVSHRLADAARGAGGLFVAR